MILSSKLIIYIIFGILLQFLVEVKSQTREAHTATFINNKLYILGGGIATDDNVPPKEAFIYLDFSNPVNTNELKSNDLSAITNNIIPPHRYAAAIKGGVNNDTLFLYGGETLGGGAMPSLVYTYDTPSNSWKTPKITGTPPTKMTGVTLVTGYNGLIYVFGGVFNVNYTNDMFVLDSINLSWKKVSSINAPSPRVQYGAVFLPNQNIIYFGGFHNNIGTFTLDEVFLYDTLNDVWTTKTTTGSIPSPRYSFSSVLGLDRQRVIIFGGLENNATPLIPGNSIYVLNINDFGWYIPRVTGNIPSSRGFHKTTLIGKYMVATFGRGYKPEVDNDILLLDISNNDEYAWVTSTVPASPNSSTTSQSSAKTDTSSSLPQSNNTGVIVGSVVGSLIGGIILTVGSFFLYKRYKSREEQDYVIPTPGESNQYFKEIIRIPSENDNYNYQSHNHVQENNPIYRY